MLPQQTAQEKFACLAHCSSATQKSTSEEIEATKKQQTDKSSTVPRESSYVKTEEVALEN